MVRPLALTREQSRRVDAVAVEHYGMSSLVLMENAGRGAVDVLLAADPMLQTAPGDRRPAAPSVVILCGKGNNAGDGLVIARHLEIRGVAAKVVLLAPPAALAGDARLNYEILTHTDIPLIDASSEPTPALLDEHAEGAVWLVDAMLGTGARGDPREPFATAIEWMNSKAARRLAVDIPSGLDCDTGRPASPTVRADLTCTFVAPKTGFMQPSATPYLGRVEVVSIGTPPAVAAGLTGEPPRQDGSAT